MDRQQKHGRSVIEDQPQLRASTTSLIVWSGLLLVALWCLYSVAHGSWAVVRDKQTELTLVITVVCTAIGVATVRSIVTWCSVLISTYLGPSRTRGISAVLSFIFYVILAVVIAGQTKLDLSGLAISGALTGVIVGIAAQASLSNIIAGLVILFARPYRPGQFVTVRAAAFAGSEYSGEVGDITLFFTTLLSNAQEIRVPNSSMVASVVVLRPQALEVYLPLVLPLGQWETNSTTGIVRQLSAALPQGRHVEAGVEQLDQTTVRIGIKASVANDAERSSLERAAMRILRGASAAGSPEQRQLDELHDL